MGKVLELLQSCKLCFSFRALPFFWLPIRPLHWKRVKKEIRSYSSEKKRAFSPSPTDMKEMHKQKTERFLALAEKILLAEKIIVLISENLFEPDHQGTQRPSTKFRLDCLDIYYWDDPAGLKGWAGWVGANQYVGSAGVLCGSCRATSKCVDSSQCDDCWTISTHNPSLFLVITADLKLRLNYQTVM